MRDSSISLFLSYSTLGRRATFIRTLSGWFSHLFSYCFIQPGKKVLGLSGLEPTSSGHTLHLSLWSTASLEGILQVGNRREHSSFSLLYLSVLSKQEGGALRLGSIVAGERVIIRWTRGRVVLEVSALILSRSGASLLDARWGHPREVIESCDP